MGSRLFLCLVLNQELNLHLLIFAYICAVQEDHCYHLLEPQNACFIFHTYLRHGSVTY